MGFVRNLKLWLSPLRIHDPEFGNLVFMHISKWPERSYWECEWIFPKTGTAAAIILGGDEDGPSSDARNFYLSLPNRFDQIMSTVRPKLEQVFDIWLHRPLPEDVFSVVRLSGFSLESLKKPIRWDISFETTGDHWLGITIPFVDDEAQEAIVDT